MRASLPPPHSAATWMVQNLGGLAMCTACVLGPWWNEEKRCEVEVGV